MMMDPQTMSDNTASSDHVGNIRTPSPTQDWFTGSVRSDSNGSRIQPYYAGSPHVESMRHVRSSTPQLYTPSIEESPKDGLEGEILGNVDDPFAKTQISERRRRHHSVGHSSRERRKVRAVSGVAETTSRHYTR
jgi:hypothetical protein